MSKKNDNIFVKIEALDPAPNRGVVVDEKALVKFFKDEILDQKFCIISEVNKMFGVNDNFLNRKGKKRMVLNWKLQRILKAHLKNVRISHRTANGGTFVVGLISINKKK